MRKGILLYSGGLDSILSAKILMEQNIELIGLFFILPFIPPDCNIEELKSSILAKSIGLPLTYYRCDHEYMDVIKNPPHGYGKHYNPCIDCKIYFLEKAKRLMKDEGASFISTGDVVGQRPMTQKKHMLYHIERVSGLRGYILRPLSAKILKPTKAEMEGLVDREKLFAINGRSRKDQIQLANMYNISDYNSPAGGCLLTDKYISRRVKDLLENHNNYNMIDIYLLTIGRHYRLHKDAKIIVSRNDRENIELEKYTDISDYLFMPHDFKGALISVKGRLSQDDIKIISGIAGRYSKNDSDIRRIAVKKKGATPITVPVADPISDELLERLRI